MNIEPLTVTVKEIAEGFEDNGDDGIVGYGGKLDIRPPYQREFIYGDKERNAVIDTVTKNYPLNVMYWAVKDNGEYEIIDGQQRTISICHFLNRHFSFNGKYWDNLQPNEQNAINEYKLMVYLCSGLPSEKLDWFETINIAGKPLTQQELKNAVYHGSWVSDAKRYFSKRGCAAYSIGKNYLSGKVERQEYLETVIKWISNGNIVEYMANNQNKSDAGELWLYFRKVIDWVQYLFPNYRTVMKGIEWGYLYNTYGNNDILNPTVLEEEISKLVKDEYVENKKGIYYYVLDKKLKYLNIRAFSISQKLTKYEEQNGICNSCKEKFSYDDMEGDHITPWIEGGKTESDNLQMLCRECNRRKSSR